MVRSDVQAQLKRIKSLPRLSSVLFSLLVCILAACSNNPNTVNPNAIELSSQATISQWQARLEAGLANSENNQTFNLKAIAKTGNLHAYAREMNMGLTSLTAAYRVNQDPDTARYIKEVLIIARNELRDYHKECPNALTLKERWDCPEAQKTKIVRDGFRNYLFLRDDGNMDEPTRRQRLTDFHQMDELLAHANLAGAAYTLRQAGYTTDAAFWTNYLKNDFEAKWRERMGKATGFPFLTRDLMHPYVHSIRYHYYMYKLTGNNAYYTEAKRMAGVVKNNMRSTQNGTGYEWAQRVELNGSAGTGCQPMVYVRETVNGLQDLAVMDSSLFDDTFMRRVAKTLSSRVLISADGSTLTGDVCGNGTYSSGHPFANYPYSAVAPWDNSGKIQAALERAYSTSASKGFYNAPAMMILSLGR